jgi:hypothetical protein
MTKRLPLIDALRGIAALGVLLAHFGTRLVLPEWVAESLHLGTLGVPLFFVLSGFVITLSIGDRHITPAYAGRFALRRSLRLDPPYFASIGVLLLIGQFGAAYGAHQPLPTLPQFIAHLFYLQDLLGMPALSPVYWSLCLEVQFYLVLLAGLAAVQSGATVAVRVAQAPVQWLAIGSIALSYLCRRQDIAAGSFVPMWFCFGMGMLTCWCARGWLPSSRLIPVLTAALLAGLWFADLWSLTAALACALIWLAGRRQRLDWLSGPLWQFFGRISYSLYLTHNIFGWYALSLAMRYMDQWLAAALGAVVAVLAAWLWYRCIEKPAVALSRQVQLP